MWSFWSRIGRRMVPLVAVAMAGCTPIQPQTAKTLAPPSMSPGSCVLDIFFVRFPMGDEEADGPLWDEIDEQRLPCELRRCLARNGFRAGVVGGRMPFGLARLLELDGKPAPSGECQQVRLEELETTPKVVRRHLQIRDGQRREILTSDVCAERDVLLSSADGVCGGSYTDAQGVLAVTACAEPDGRVRLDLVPELHYGKHVPRYVGRQYAFRMETSRSREVFDDLALSVTLTAEEMLVVSGLPDRLSSLGHHFFTQETSGRKERKLLVIRLSQTQHDGLFLPDGVQASDGPPPVAGTSDVPDSVGRL